MNQGKLTSPRIIIKLLKDNNILLKKAYGQHFLIDDNIRQKIISAAELNQNDVALEIGPGIGTLSQEIAPKTKKLWLIELEKRFIPILEHTLSEHKNVQIRQADALKMSCSGLKPPPNKVVSNLPYNIAAPLIIKLLSECPSITKMVLMVQEEMAKRLTSRPDTADYGALTLKVSYLAKVETLFKVTEQVFLPKPRVKSAVISIKKLPRKVDPRLFSLIEKAFRHRRKSIKRTLLIAGFDEEQLEKALLQAGIDKITRPQSLELQKFQELAKALYNH